jgi:hypothetical protein
MDKMDINKYENTSFFDGIMLFVWQNWFFSLQTSLKYYRFDISAQKEFFHLVLYRLFNLDHLNIWIEYEITQKTNGICKRLERCVLGIR